MDSFNKKQKKVTFMKKSYVLSSHEDHEVR